MTESIYQTTQMGKMVLSGERVVAWSWLDVHLILLKNYYYEYFLYV